jgi:putative transposase
MREVVNALFYLVKAGCSWRLLPHEFAKWQTVYTYFNAWRKSGQWEAWNQLLREQVRERAGREASPSAGSIDSQSVKTSQKGAALRNERPGRRRGQASERTQTASHRGHLGPGPESLCH